MTRLKSLVSLVVLIVLLNVPTLSWAERQRMFGDVQIEVVSDRKGSLPFFTLPSNNNRIEKHYIMAKPNTPYHLRVSNQSSKRVGVVLTVDGRNILNGRDSKLQSNEAMTILAPYETRYYEGWQRGRHRIDAFTFTSSKRYANSAWEPHNGVGMIALAVFKQRHNGRKGYANNHYGNNGRANNSHKKNRYFVPGKRAVAKKFIRYESRRDLCQKGIVQCRPQKRRDNFRNGSYRNTSSVSFPSYHFELRF